jgi:hypothetical protein
MLEGSELAWLEGSLEGCDETSELGSELAGCELESWARSGEDNKAAAVASARTLVLFMAGLLSAYRPPRPNLPEIKVFQAEDLLTISVSPFSCN